MKKLYLSEDFSTLEESKDVEIKTHAIHYGNRFDSTYVYSIKIAIYYIVVLVHIIHTTDLVYLHS